MNEPPKVRRNRWPAHRSQRLVFFRPNGNLSADPIFGGSSLEDSMERCMYIQWQKSCVWFSPSLRFFLLPFFYQRFPRKSPVLCVMNSSIDVRTYGHRRTSSPCCRIFPLGSPSERDRVMFIQVLEKWPQIDTLCMYSCRWTFFFVRLLLLYLPLARSSELLRPHSKIAFPSPFSPILRKSPPWPRFSTGSFYGSLGWLPRWKLEWDTKNTLIYLFLTRSTSTVSLNGWLRGRFGG